MHVIVAAFGTAGDTLPLVALGRLLRRAGHDVDFLGLQAFGSTVQEAGLAFHAIGPASTFEELSRDPAAWHPYKGFAVLWKLMARAIPDTLAHIEALRRPGQTVLVGSSGALGARLAQEKWRLPLVTVHMAPFYLFSRVENCLGGVSLPAWGPLWLRRLAFAGANRFFIDGLARADFNRLRAGLGLPPSRSVVTHWSHSPDRVVCAVPDWFAPRQPDWPEQTVSIAFPIDPEATAAQPPWQADAALRAFLDAGPPPIVFCASTGMATAATFFQRAVEVGRLLRRRVLLVSRTAAPIPQPLPQDAHHLEYAPFAHLLPLAAGIVHQGGIGTIALALRASLPQVIVPFAYDQFYNGQCVARLGVGRSVPRVTPAPKMAAMVRDVLDSKAVRSRCAYYGAAVRAQSCGVAALAGHVTALEPAAG